MRSDISSEAGPTGIRCPPGCCSDAACLWLLVHLPVQCASVGLPRVEVCNISLILWSPDNLPHRYTKRPTMSGPGLYDPTEVMNRAQLNLYTREGFVKVGFYVVSFLVYLYK